MSKKTLLFCAVIVLAPLIAAREAEAHATPVSYDPVASTILEAPPERVWIKFSERVEPDASRILVFGPDGVAADHGDFRINQDDAHFASVGFGGSARGTYAVSWQVISADDGHFTKGAYTFSFGEASGDTTSTASFTVLPSTTYTEAFTIFLELLGEALLMGALCAFALFKRLRMQFPALQQEELLLKKRFVLLVVFGVSFALAGGFFYLVLKSIELAELGGTIIQAFQTFAATVAGSYTLYRMGLVLIFIAVFSAFKKRIIASEKLITTGIIFILILIVIAFLRARVSHAAASPFLPVFSVFINAVHLVFKELWIGLVGAAAYMLSAIMNTTDGAASFVMKSISGFTAIALTLGGATGVYIVWLHLKSPANLFTSDWGVRFSILSLLALLLLLARLFNQFVIGEQFASRGLWFETFVSLIVLFMSSYLIITTPPLGEKTIFEKSVSSEGAHIVLNENAADPNQFLVTIHDSRITKNLVVILENRERGIGPNTVTVERIGQNAFLFSKTNLTPPGLWEVALTAQREGVYDANAFFSIDYPRELAPSEPSKEARTFGWFEAASLIVALGMFLLGGYLYKVSKKTL